MKRSIVWAIIFLISLIAVVVCIWLGIKTGARGWTGGAIGAATNAIVFGLVYNFRRKKENNVNEE